MVVVAAAYLTSRVIADVFVGGASLAEVTPLLVAVAVLAVVRAALLFGADALARSAARRTKGHLRADLTAHLFALGPRWTTRERIGELTGVAVRRAGRRGRLRHVVPAGPGAGGRRAAAGPRCRPRARPADRPRPAVHRADPRPAARVHRRPGTGDHRPAIRRGPLPRRVLPRHAGRSGDAQGVRPEPRTGRQHRDDQPAVRRHDDGGAADRVPDVARARMGRRGRGRARRGRDQPAADGRRHRVRPGARGAHHRPRVLPAAADAGHDATTPGRPVDRSPSGRSRSSTSRSRRAVARSSRRLARDASPRTGAGRHPVDGRPVHLSRVARRPRSTASTSSSVAARVVALVGATGAGKTTIANLLLRFATAGRGIDRRRRHATREHRPRRLASPPRLGPAAPAPVPRHRSPTTSASPVRTRPTTSCGRPPREAGADRFIDALPRGFDTPVGEGGTRLSGGQRQRIAIARAFLADAWLVILDEATSHLDAESETVIRDAVRRLAARGRTVLVVSHRLRLAEIADVVAVLDAGRIVETGSPADLAGRDGPYRRCSLARRRGR